MAKKAEPIKDDEKEISKNLMSALLNGYKETHFNFTNPDPFPVSSGSLKLDFYLKVKTGMTIRMGGPAEVGKTSQSMLFAKNFMESVPKSKTIYINAEAKFGEEIRKRTGLKFVESADEWEYGSVFVLHTNVFDTICDVLVAMLKTMHAQGEHLCIIIDSVDMLTFKSTLEKSVTDGKKPAGVNYITKEMFRRISHLIKSYNALLIMITQYSAVFNIDPYAKEAPQLMEGNNTHALNHQCTYALYYRPRGRKDYILEDDEAQPDVTKNKILGVNAKIDIKKSATDESNYTLEIPIKKGRVGNCIWTEKEIFDALLYWGFLKKKGAWIDISEDFNKMAKEDKIDLKLKHQGLGQFSEYFEQNKTIAEWVATKIKTVHD